MSNHQVWDFWASHYDHLWVQKWSLRPTRKTILAHLSQFLPGDKKVEILDMGCGTGQLLEKLSLKFEEHNLSLTGVDYSEKMIENAKLERPDIAFVHSDVMAFSSSFQYDIIIVSHSFPYYEDQPAALKKLSELLKPEGTIIITNASATTLYDKLTLLMIKLTTWWAHYPSMQELQLNTEQHFDEVAVSKVKTRWFVPTILFLTARGKGDIG